MSEDFDRVHQAIVDDMALRKRAYDAIPEEARDDLASFCRANTTCFHPDPRIHAALEGRREVWLRMQQHWTMTPYELADIIHPRKSGEQE